MFGIFNTEGKLIDGPFSKETEAHFVLGVLEIAEAYVDWCDSDGVRHQQDH